MLSRAMLNMAMSLSVWAAGPVTAEKEEAGCVRK